MDWKAYYRGELESDEGRRLVGDALAQHRGGDARVLGAFGAEGVVSFPHTRLRGSAEPIARVVQSLLAFRPDRVIALGVLHGSTAPAWAREELATYARETSRLRFGPPDAAVDAVFARLGGAFFDGRSVETPWGVLPVVPPHVAGPLLREDPDLLAHEFSLDLFLATLVRAAEEAGVAPPAVTPLFVLLTRDAAGTLDAAIELARLLRGLRAGRTAFVATGDLVHWGNGYSPPEETARLPLGRRARTRFFRAQVELMLSLATDRSAAAAAFVDAESAELRSDQRHLLPVIVHIAGPHARAELLSFELTDYSDVLGVAPPCVVASALVTFAAPAATGEAVPSPRE